LVIKINNRDLHIFLVLHDFFTEFGQTKIYVYKKPEGFGLVCHRAIRTMCELIGIKDLYAKIEGPTNLGHIVKAFMLGILRQVQLILLVLAWILSFSFVILKRLLIFRFFEQKSHQLLAEEKQLYLVEQREEHGNFPVIVAAPSHCRSENEIKYDEILDFSQVKKRFKPVRCIKSLKGNSYIFMKHFRFALITVFR
jgi:small subunit ribosomal protein S5